MSADRTHRPDQVDWSQIWYPGPTRVFTADEMARAGTDRPSRTLLTVTMLNYALAGFVLMQMAPPSATAALSLLLAIAGVIAWLGLRRLWVRPDRRSLAVVSTIGSVALMLGLIGTIELKDLARGQPPREWVVVAGIALAMLVTVVYWFAAVFRAHQIESRLRELAERERALDMARQLAAAQIQPHFLFNSLASLQHWVQAKDDRAAPMLMALTAFLRATLPLFNRQRLALGDEAEAVRQYLEVVRLRLGDRLHYGIHIDPTAAPAQVPPGLLLTLVENAVEHGVMPSLSGADVQVTASVQGSQLTVSVHDTGPGLPTDAQDGVGLANSRERLQQAFAAAASLTLENAPDGGCTARIVCPLETA
jgi:signal transduction histidine kinase